MLKYLFAFLVSTAHAQSPAEIERLCARMVDLPEIIEVYKACEAYDPKRYAETLWKARVVALMKCLKSGKARTTERQRTGIEFCFSELRD